LLFRSILYPRLLVHFPKLHSSGNALCQSTMQWHQSRVLVQVRCGYLWLWPNAPSGGETRQLTSGRYCFLFDIRAQRMERPRSREMDLSSMTGCQIRKRSLPIIIVFCHYYVSVELVER
jgi:hypothetical protein